MKANLDKNLAPAWVSGKSYSTGEFCLYNKRLYICTTDNSDAEFDNSKWERRNLVDLVSGLNSNLFNNSKKIIEVSTAGKGQIYVKAEFDCEYVKATKDTVPVHNDGSVYPTTLTNVDSGEVTTVTTSATKLPCKGTYIYQLNQANLAQGYFSCVDIIPCNAND